MIKPFTARQPPPTIIAGNHPPHDFDFNREPMEIKRTIAVLIETNRRFAVREGAKRQTVCPQCGEAMTAAEAAAGFFKTNCRAVYRSIEAGQLHFTETDDGATLVCLVSLAAFLQTERAGNNEFLDR